MSEERASLKDAVKKWHATCGEIRLGDGGTPFVMIPSKRMLESLRILAKSLKENGYTHKEMNSTATTMFIVDTCWREDKIKKMSRTDVKAAKFSLALDWESVLADFLDFKISTLDDSEKVVPVPKEVREVKEEFQEKFDPSKRISGVNATGYDETPYDLELLAELGIEPPKDDNER